MKCQDEVAYQNFSSSSNNDITNISKITDLLDNNISNDLSNNKIA